DSTATLLSTGTKRMASTLATVSSQSSTDIVSVSRFRLTSMAISQAEIAETRSAPFSALASYSIAAFALSDSWLSPFAHQSRVCVSSTIMKVHPSRRLPQAPLDQ